MVAVSNMRQDHKAARAWLDKASKAGVNTNQISLEQAKIEIAEGSYAQAHQRLQRITDVEPAFLEAWALQANLLIAQNKTEEAERDIIPRMKRLSLDTPQYLTAITEAFALRAKGPAFFKSARELFLLALRLQPGSRPVLSEILKIDSALRDQAAAEQHAAALLRLDHDDALANYVMGSLLITRGDLAGAEESLSRSAATDPSTSIFNDLAEVLRMRHKIPEAEAAVRQALTLNPRNAYAHDTLACILLDLGQVDEAGVSSEKARALAPDAIPFRLTTARILALKGNKIEARVVIHELNSHQEQLSPQQIEQIKTLEKDLRNLK